MATVRRATQSRPPQCASAGGGEEEMIRLGLDGCCLLYTLYIGPGCWAESWAGSLEYSPVWLIGSGLKNPRVFGFGFSIPRPEPVNPMGLSFYPLVDP